jgi:hypothetical protein
MWEAQTGEQTRFVYLLTWPDVRTIRDAWTRFLVANTAG